MTFSMKPKPEVAPKMTFNIKWKCSCGTQNWRHKENCVDCGTLKPLDPEVPKKEKKW